jgi:23S rRNA pseudouridine1911/1915/1917 synthase
VDVAVPPDAAGTRLDVFLAEHAGSRAAAQKLIDAGLVEVDGQRRPKRHTLSGGERLTVAPAPQAAVPDVPDAPFTIAYEDEHLLVVDKPAGVVTHPGANNEHGTLVQALRGRTAGGDPERPGVVHRLDRDTSGLLVVARTEDAHAALSELIAAREVLRQYAALVEGRPPARTGTIEAPLGRDRRIRTRMSTDTDDPRDAVTHFEVEEAFARTTLLRVRLETGRTHQIRAHLKAIGFPVCGDPEYGSTGRLGLRRQFLHAGRLAFAHPLTGAAVDVSSPLPDELHVALHRAAAE